jgi:mannitol 2-dehydrogenase
MGAKRLSTATLSELPASIARPSESRSQVTPGIVHFGVGGFHRAHEAMVVDTLMNEGLAQDWGIVGVGVRPPDRAMKEALLPQDCLYTLTVKDMDSSSTRIIGSVIDFLYAPDDPEAVLSLLAHENIRIVSLTITEGGYNFDQVTGEFDWSNRDIADDLTRPDSPHTVFGFITEALRRRREAGVQPFTVMSCDNIQGNGHLAKKMFVSYATRVDSELADWMDDSVAFPNSMVDRITPVTTPENIAEAEAITGLADAWPVVAETFFQWVLEDHFPAGRPAFERAGVQLVEDVEPYELMKLRLLNASHQALAYFGYLMGYRLVHDAVNDDAIQALLRRYMAEEAQATLRPVPGVNLADYQNTLITRFTNAEVKDTVARLCAESSDRIPKWLVPVIRERLAQGLDVRLSAAVVASWATYAKGIDEQGSPIDVVDNLKSEVMELASRLDEDPLAFVSHDKLFGDLATHEGFVRPYLWAVTSLATVGAAATLHELLSPND